MTCWRPRPGVPVPRCLTPHPPSSAQLPHGTISFLSQTSALPPAPSIRMTHTLAVVRRLCHPQRVQSPPAPRRPLPNPAAPRGRSEAAARAGVSHAPPDATTPAANKGASSKTTHSPPPTCCRLLRHACASDTPQQPHRATMDRQRAARAPYSPPKELWTRECRRRRYGIKRPPIFADYCLHVYVGEPAHDK